MAHRFGLLRRPTSLVISRCRASVGCLPRRNDDCRDESADAVGPTSQKHGNWFLPRSSGGFGAMLRSSRCSPSTDLALCRHMSTAIGEDSGKIEFVSDMADVLADSTVQSVASQAVAPAASEVAVAAADSFFPVMGLQYFIDYVHQLSGFNWWASIVLTTILIRGATLPLLINQLKATTKLADRALLVVGFLGQWFLMIRPRMEEIKGEMEQKGMEPRAMDEGQRKMKQLFKESGVSPFTPLKGIFIQGPVFISFFMAITNMAEKVPSFKEGGAFWFLDLSTPDPYYALPILTGLAFLITVEEGMEGNSAAGTMKNVSRGLAVLTVPFTMTFPKALFCYWITSNVFSLVYGLVIKRPDVKKFLGIPDMPPSPPASSQQSAFSVFSALKKSISSNENPTPTLAPSPKLAVDRKVSSQSILSKRLKTLEKEVKGRKKNRKR